MAQYNHQEVHPRAECCAFDGTITHPRIMTESTQGQTITIAKWICPKCGNLFKTGEVKR